MCACEHGNLEVARLLMNHPNCNINLKDNVSSLCVTMVIYALL